VSPAKLEALLYHLCVEYGFCLRPDEYRRLCADPPAEVSAFTDAVYRAEGLDPGRPTSAYTGWSNPRWSGRLAGPARR
jgi:hypothetical protein